MKNKLGVALMALGTVLLICAVVLVLYNRQEAEQAGVQASQVVALLEEKIPAAGPAGSDGVGEPDPLQPGIPSLIKPEVDPTMTEAEIDGYRYIGFLTLEKLGLKLPVMTDWSYSQLRIAPCRYLGSTKSDDLVIMAHNYDQHFGRLQTLSVGDVVAFTDMDGYVTRYRVVAIEILSPGAVEEMTAGEYDLTLFTCTYGGQSRVTVRCDRMEE